MSRDFKSYSGIIKIILLGSFITGIIISGLGLLMIYQGATGETEFVFFGQKFKSTNVGIAAIFIGGSLIVLLIKRSLKSLDSVTKISLSKDITNKQRDKDSENVFERILDILSTHRAFFKGDEQLFKDTQYAISNIELFKQLGYLDAGRSIVVAESFAKSIKIFQEEFSKLETINSQVLKEQLSTLIVMCKDYIEKFGKDENASNLSLPHIGRNQRMFDFNRGASQYVFNSNDSIEAFKQLLEYLLNSCEDLILIREQTLSIVENIKKQKNYTKERAEHIQTEILNGIKTLGKISEIFKEIIYTIEEVLRETSFFDERRNLLKEKSQLTNGIVSYLLNAISNVRSSKSWVMTSDKTIITKAEYLKDYHLKVFFADGQNFDVQIGNEIWDDFSGFHMEEETFKSFFIDFEQNEIRWHKENRARMTGEHIRNQLVKIKDE